MENQLNINAEIAIFAQPVDTIDVFDYDNLDCETKATRLTSRIAMLKVKIKHCEQIISKIKDGEISNINNCFLKNGYLLTLLQAQQDVTWDIYIALTASELRLHLENEYDEYRKLLKDMISAYGYLYIRTSQIVEYVQS
ncbi:hypothetical protein [Providencia hangzhouensis]|uniref:hypothetical protein n=1 Tax=Providencia hangzhouensis TaxID=3031799 RepID=UPI0034DDA73D